jgi:hypothetical protein
MMRDFLIRLLFLFCGYGVFPEAAHAHNVKIVVADVCVYGGTSAGVIAAYTAKKMGKSVVLIEPGRHLGGMSSGGLGYTDIGNKYVVSGLALDFYRRIGKHYGKFEQWIFEPHVAEGIFKDYVKIAGFKVFYNQRVTDFKKDGATLKQITLENNVHPGSISSVISAKVFIDCSYEGDLVAGAGVSYTTGRESNSTYGETVNGVQLQEGHQFPDAIDPYIIPGDASSGLLWGITKETLQPNGSGDSKIQAYCFRVALTNIPQNRVAITKPDNYEASRYELWLRLMRKSNWKSLNDCFIWGYMPGNKTDINNRGGFSLDMIGMNWGYPDGSYDQRAAIWKAHEDYTKGLFYFIGSDGRVPAVLRNEMAKWGYPKDEYTDNGNWSHQLYIREARRMVGALVMTQQHCEGKQVIDDGVGFAAYTMDSHNCDRLLVNGMVKNEGNVEKGGFGPFPIAYRAVTPKKGEATNLLVPVCLSASHIAYGSIRMEPVFMVLAQSSAVAACLAIDQKVAVQDVKVKNIQNELKANPLVDGTEPEVLVDNDDTAHIKVKGDWKLETYEGYGPSYLSTDSGGNKSVRFIPRLNKTGTYRIYVYYPKLKNVASKVQLNVFDGQKNIAANISRDEVKVEGQTSGEWVALGDYRLPAGEKAYVEIDNKHADGTVPADAVLFVPAK